MIYILRKNNNVLKNVLNDIANLHPDKTWQVDVKEHKNNRSLAQNRLMWDMLSVLSDWNGDTTETWHKTLRVEAGLYEDFEKDGKTYTELLSSAKFNTEQMTAYIDYISYKLLEHGLTYDKAHYGMEIR